MTDEAYEQLQKMISDEELESVFAGTNFGANSKPREIVADTVLKIGGGYGTGHTAMCCCQELGLMGKSLHEPRLTKKGRKYMYWSHKPSRTPSDVTDKADGGDKDALDKSVYHHSEFDNDGNETKRVYWIAPPDFETILAALQQQDNTDLMEALEAVKENCQNRELSQTVKLATIFTIVECALVDLSKNKAKG